jgi:hypothetical protein
LAGLVVLVIMRAVVRAIDRADAEEAQRELLALLAERADDRVIADNLDV